jgi:hypothetical protein
MRKQMKKQGIFLGLGLLAAVLLLGGCGESDNIGQNDVGAVNDCNSIPGASCVRGRFIDDAAVNVNYECGIDGAGLVRSVTAADGGFVCPNGSEATFSLTHPDNSALKITLGKVRISKPANLSGSGQSSSHYFYVTPRHLASDNSSTGPSQAAVNITRFLQTLSEDTLDTDLPSHRVIISDATKRKITAAVVKDIDFKLPLAATPAAPADGTFEAAVKPFLQSVSKSLISNLEGNELLQKGVYSTMAGVYESFDLTAQATSSAAGGMYGVGGGNFVGALWNLVDRRGRTIGSGVYSYKAAADTVLWSEPKAMSLKSTPNPSAPSVASNAWPLNGDLDGFTYDLVTDIGDPTGQIANITNGIMRRGAIAGNTHTYEALFAETPNSSDLGRWSLSTSPTTTPLTGGSLTLVHTAPAAPSMNPDLWRPDRINFPIPVTVKLMNSDFTCSSLGCEIASFRMVILRDGNIISDKHGRCGKEFIPPTGTEPARYADINPETLKYEDNAQEVPIGVVQNILGQLHDDNGATMEAMTMLVMIPNDPDFRAISPYLPYVQFGSGFGDDSLLRVDGSVNSLRSYGFCTEGKKSDGVCQRQGVFAVDRATWRNNLTTVKAFNSAATQAEKDNVGGFIVSLPTPAASCP